MIYICISTRNNAATAGLVLWKIRQVFEEFPREYQILVADDGSTDGTLELLEPYTRALPMTLIGPASMPGYAASVELLINKALELTDRPKRDCVVSMPADFSVSPSMIPELIKKTESGADVVVGEASQTALPAVQRMIRRSASWILRPGIRLSGIKDLMSGVYAFRLVTLRACVRDRGGSLLTTDGRCASVELLARGAALARQIAVVPIPTQAAPQAPARDSEGVLALIFNMARAGRTLAIPAPQAPIQRA